MKSDELFLKELAESRDAVHRFAWKCRKDGILAWVAPERTRPDASQRNEYSDSGDLMVQGRVEHKNRKKLTFTSSDDYPFRTVFVCEVRREPGNSEDEPLAYVIENADGTHAAVVYGWTRDKWEKENVFDKKSNKRVAVFSVDKKYVRFCDLSKDRVF